MKNKGLAMFGVFALVLFSLSVVSADSASNFSLTIVDDLPASVEAGETYSVKVKFENTNSNYTGGVSIVFTGGDMTLPSNLIVMDTGSPEFDLNLTVPGNEGVGSFSRDLSVSVYNASNLSVKIVDLSVDFTSDVPEVSYCEDEGTSEIGDLEIKSFDINNNGEGKDDVWHLLDEIEIDVDIKNTHNDDSVKKVLVELKILDKKGNDVTNDFDFDDEEYDIGKINDRETESATFIIDEIPIDLDEGTYFLYVRAYSDDDEQNQCVSKDSELDDFGASEYYAEIEVKNDFEDGIIVRDSFNTLSAVCGQNNVEYSFDVYNVGDDKEEEVIVRLLSSELGIDERVIIDNFQSGKRKNVNFLLNIPEDLEKSFYFVDIITYWDWDDDEDEFELFSYDDNSDTDLDDGDFRFKLDILGCSVDVPKPIVDANLVSDEVLVGQDVVVSVTVSNPSSKRDDFVVSVDGYESWAELIGVEPTVLNLGPGESADVAITFNAKGAGVNNFNVRVVSSDNDVVQDVSLSVLGGDEDELFNFGAFSLSGNLTYWIVGVLVVLILFLFALILVVSIKRRATL